MNIRNLLDEAKEKEFDIMELDMRKLVKVCESSRNPDERLRRHDVNSVQCSDDIPIEVKATAYANDPAVSTAPAPGGCSVTWNREMSRIQSFKSNHATVDAQTTIDEQPTSVSVASGSYRADPLRGSSASFKEDQVLKLLELLTSELQELETSGNGFFDTQTEPSAEALRPTHVQQCNHCNRPLHSDENGQMFIKKVRLCITIAQEIAAQVAITLEYQDAKISSLTQNLGHSFRQSCDWAQAPDLRGAASLSAQTERKSEFCCLMEQRSECVSSIPSQAPPINEQLDFLLDRLHLLLSGGTTTQNDQVWSTGILPRRLPEDNMNQSLTSEFADGHHTTTLSKYSIKDFTESAVSALELEVERLKGSLFYSKAAQARVADGQQNQETNHSNGLQPSWDKRVVIQFNDDEVTPLGNKQVTVDEAKMKACFVEELQEGSWFFRVDRKFGPIGKALRSVSYKRAFVWISYDFSNLYCSANEPHHINSRDASYDSSSSFAGSSRRSSKDIVIVVPLHNVIGFVYGAESRAYRLQESRGNCHPAHLCVSMWTKRQSLDLIALNEQEIERWYLGLNSLLPFFPGRVFLTPNEFATAKQRLKVEHLTREQQCHRLDSEEQSDRAYW